jgi:hypothetical protein
MGCLTAAPVAACREGPQAAEGANPVELPSSDEALEALLISIDSA